MSGRAVCVAVVLTVLTLSPRAAHAQSEPNADDSEPDVAERLQTQQRQLTLQSELLEQQRKQLQALEKRLERSDAGTDSEQDAKIDEIVAEADTDAESASIDYESGRPLRIYGFMDAGFNKLFVPKSSFLYPLTTTNAGTFVLGNVNLFFDAEPREGWRGLVELRFTNAPHGQDASFASPTGTEYERVDRRVDDSNGANGRSLLPLGSLIIERAQIEWNPIDQFNLLAGLWLTPFGIWNTDHGTPTLISLVLPSLQVDEYAPTRQLGLQAKGSAFSGAWELGYHAYVSNGRTPGEQDLDEDKAFGGRLFATEFGADWRTTLGVSGYYGTYTDVAKRIESFSPFVVEIEQTVAGKEWAAGIDLSVDADSTVRLRTEAAVHRVTYEPGKRRPAADGPPGSVEPDAYELDWYALAAYRLPWWGLEPYLWFEAIHRPSALGDTVLVPAVGVNAHLAPEVQLKVQYAHVTFHDFTTNSPGNPSDNDFGALVSRLVLSF